MTFNRYYQEELAILRDLGREFAAKNPGLAPLLASPGRDPDVERLLEGFSFLTGRLRHKLEDELPEITHSLFNLLWPNYLRPVPSCAVIQYSPEPGLTQPLIIPKGSRVEARPVEGTKCVFSTVYEVEVSPLTLTRAGVKEKAGRSLLALRFELGGVTLEQAEFSRLNFFISGEPLIAASLYHTLLTKVDSVQLAVFDDDGLDRPFLSLPQAAIRTMAFEKSNAMFPYPANTFPGYRLLQEYFCFPDKFMFLELNLPADWPGRAPESFRERSVFEIQFHLREAPNRFESLQAENFGLFCTPAVNLFSFDAAPIAVSHTQTEYRIVPDPRRPAHFSVYSVDKVSGWSNVDKRRTEYPSFESFEHGPGSGRTEAYYSLRVRPSVADEGTETYISLIHPGQAIPAGAETLSLELTCTNRLLPRKLDVGDISLPTDDSRKNISFRNITPVSGTYAPPLSGDLPWRLISNMSLNYISLVNVQALKSIITAYDFRALHDKSRAMVLARNLGGLLAIESSPADRIYNGLPLRGSRTHLTIRSDAFVCEGDMYLFCSVLNEFMTLYATVNSFHELTATDDCSGERYGWPARIGTEAA